MVYVSSGWPLAWCRRSSFSPLISEQHVLFISHYCWLAGVDKNLIQFSLLPLQLVRNSLLTFTASRKAASVWNKPLELLSHFRDLASILDLEWLVFKRKALSSPTGDCCLSKINIMVIEILSRHTVTITWAWYCIFQHHVQSAAACWQVPSCLLDLSSGRTQIVFSQEEFVMIINDILSVCNHLISSIFPVLGAIWQKRISWEGWARGT